MTYAATWQFKLTFKKINPKNVNQANFVQSVGLCDSQNNILKPI